MYNFDLWKTSGHADHYKEHMFLINIEKQEFGLKPMNCPGASACHLTREMHAMQVLCQKLCYV